MSIELNPIANPEKIGGFNTNFQLIEDELNENVLRRQGLSPGEANHMEVSLDMNSNSILNVSTDTSDPGSLLSLGDADTRFVFVSGDTMTGNLSMGGFGVTNLRTPTSSSEATRKDYVDSGLAGKVSKSGDSMSGDLNMVQNDINNIGTTRTGNLILNGVQVSPNELDESGVIWVKTLADLQALPTGGLVDGQGLKITTTGRAGDVIVRVGDFSAEVAADPEHGIWMPFNSDPTGASIVAMRLYNRWSPLITWWFGADPEGASDSSTAVQSAIDYAKYSGVDKAHSPAGTYLYSQEFVIDDHVSFTGDGKRSTFFKPASGYSGWFLQLNEVTFVGTGDDGPLINLSADTSTVSLKDFSIVGEQSITETQHGIRFVGRCDRVHMESVYAEMLQGTHFHLGHQNGVTTNPAFARECVFIDVESRGGGESSGDFPAFVVDSHGSGDASNLNAFYSTRIIFPYHVGLRILNNSTGNRIRRQNFYNLLLHGDANSITTADQMQVMGDVSNCRVYGFESNSTNAGQWAVTVQQYNSADPFSLVFDGNITSGLGNGFDIQVGRKIRLMMDSLGSSGTDIQVGSGVTGAIHVDLIGDTSPSLNIDASVAPLVSHTGSLVDELPGRFSRVVLGDFSNAPVFTQFNGDPEGNVTAPAGSICINRNQNGQRDSDTVYLKRGGVGNTGWAPAQVIEGSATRPSSPVQFQMFIDTSLGTNGKPIWWNGTNWVDAMDNIV